MTHEEYRHARLIVHEWHGHFPMAVSTGLSIECITFDAGGGRIKYKRMADTVDNLIRLFWTTAAGPIADAPSADDLPHWPLDPYAHDPSWIDDIGMLRSLSDRLDLSEDDYTYLLGKALEISSTRRYCRIGEIASGMFDCRPVVTGAMVADLITLIDEVRT